MTSPSLKKGIFLMVSGISFLCFLDVIVKILSEDFPLNQIMFFRSFIAAIICIIIIQLNDNIRSFKTKRIHLHFLRSLSAGIGALLIFYGLSKQSITDVIVVCFTLAPFITGLSALILKEKVRLYRWTAVAIALSGALFIVQPGTEFFQPISIIVLCGSFLLALAVIIAKIMLSTEKPTTIVFWNMIFWSAFSFISLFFFWVTPGLMDIMYFILLGFFGGFAQIFLNAALKEADASTLAPFDYVSLLWAIIFDIAIWNIFPKINVYIGAAIIISSGLFILHREKIVNQRRQLHDIPNT